MLFISHSSTALCLIKPSALIFDTRSVKGLWQQWGSSHGAAATRSATASLGITFHSNSIAVCNHCESDRDHDVRSGLCCGSCGVCRASDPTSSSSCQSRLRCRRRRSGRRGHVEATREGGGGGGGGGPPGFVSPGVLDRSGTSSPTVPGSGTGAPGAMASGGVQPPASNSLSGGFRDRERGPRASTKGEMQGDQSTHGNSGSGKLGRNAYANAGAMEARPLGRRPEMNVRRHEPPSQKHAEEMRLQQAKRAALARAQSMGAPGNFKSFDSPFGNFMLPVIPLQFYNKPQSPAASSGALTAPSVPSTPIGGGLDR
ncbi:hypothetical protein CY35_01G035300 [Sphagnum magellanicum]|nr:hypothetical protein CY35_01G035300 [Sphagnum magellanicum]